MEILIPILILAAIGLIGGVGLALASKFMAVPVDEKQEKVREALPGANCGACGYSGCDGYAAAVAAGEAEPNKCAPGGESTVKALSELLGVSIENKPQVAFIGCNGTPECVTQRFEYQGMQSCAAANLVHGGPNACTYGCLGLGDCVKACTFGGITMVNNRPVICTDMCVGCGQCAAACPKSLVSLIPKEAKVRVGCSNKSRGPQVAKSCSVSCIACKLCEKNCPEGAVKVVDNLAVIDYELCTACGKCKEVCKRNVFC